MAAAALAQQAAARFIPSLTSKSDMAAPEPESEDLQEEKEFIAAFKEIKTPLPPDEVAQSPENKKLGKQSKTLSVKDFELVRTLGTGTVITIIAGWRGSD